jgi:hypothetical protein
MYPGRRALEPSRRRSGSGARAARHEVGDEALVAGRVLARDDHGLGEGRSGGVGAHELGLDLARLESLSAQLDLVVEAPEELQHTVVEVAHQVAGAVHARARERRARPVRVGSARPRAPAGAGSRA